jgi:hypothetical protein
MHLPAPSLPPAFGPRIQHPLPIQKEGRHSRRRRRNVAKTCPQTHTPLACARGPVMQACVSCLGLLAAVLFAFCLWGASLLGGPTARDPAAMGTCPPLLRAAGRPRRLTSPHRTCLDRGSRASACQERTRMPLERDDRHMVQTARGGHCRPGTHPGRRRTLTHRPTNEACTGTTRQNWRPCVRARPRRCYSMVLVMVWWTSLIPVVSVLPVMFYKDCGPAPRSFSPG